MDEAVVGRVRELRDQVQGTVFAAAHGKDHGSSGRDAIAAEREALASARSAGSEGQSKLVAARRDREAACAKIHDHEQELEGAVAEIQAEDRGAARQATCSAPLPAGPIRYGSAAQLIWPVNGPVVSGFGMRWRPDAPGDRHRRSRPERRSAPPPPARSSSPSPRPTAAATATTPASTTVGACDLLRPPGVLRRPRRPAGPSGPGDRLPAAPGTASARICTSRCAIGGAHGPSGVFVGPNTQS